MKKIYKHKGYYNGIDAVLNCDLPHKQSLPTSIMTTETSSLAKTIGLMMSSILLTLTDVSMEISSLSILSEKSVRMHHSTYC